MFDVVASKQLLCRPIPNKDAYWSIVGVATSSDAARLAFLSGNDHKTAFLTILEGTGWKQQRDVKLPSQPLSLVGSPDGSWFAVGSTDKLIRVYSEEGDLVATLKGHADWPRGLSTTSSGSYLASIDVQSGLRVWDTSNWSLTRHMKAVRGTGVDFDPSSSCLATVRRWGRSSKDPSYEVLRITDLATGKVRREHRLPGFGFEVARFSPDGQWLACGIENLADVLHTEAVLLDAETGRVHERLRGPFDWFADFVFLPQRKAIAIAIQGHTRRPLVLWELSEWPPG